MFSIRSGTTTSVGVLLLEVVLIVLGVLLGLAANAWRESAAEQEAATTALQYVRAEIAYNQAQVEGHVGYHEQMDGRLDSLIYDIEAGQEPTDAALRAAMPEGFRSPILSRAAWDLAHRTGAVNHLDFELVAGLERLYGLQQFLQNKVDYIGSNFYVAGNIRPGDLSSTIYAFGFLANDIAIQEQKLARLYPAVLDELDARLPEDLPPVPTSPLLDHAATASDGATASDEAAR